jgi:hypothetical protein
MSSTQTIGARGCLFLEKGDPQMHSDHSSMDNLAEAKGGQFCHLEACLSNPLDGCALR